MVPVEGSKYTERFYLVMRVEETESGYMEQEETNCYVGSTMREVEVLATTSSNVIAVGRRYGRKWFLKALRPEFRESAVMRRRLLKEFELHSRLRHPNIVQSVGLEEIEGLGLCIVEEWVDGITLHQALRNGKLTNDEKRRIIHRLTDAVSYLHRSGVVHRDIKPSNVMLRATGGEVVLIDFGLADSDDYTESKGPAGTPGFISPEQLESGRTSPADDVYSLGVLIREVAPRYGKLAGRCTGPATCRPKDGGELLKALRRRDRLPKVFLGTIISLALAAASTMAIWRIIGLEQSADDSLHDITILKEENTRNQLLVTTLRDSLKDVRGRLSVTRDELTKVQEYESLRQRMFSEGRYRIDRKLQEYDRNVFSKMTPEDAGVFTEKMIAMLNSLKLEIEDYVSSLTPTDLVKEDLEKIRMELYNHEAVKIAEYQEKWQHIIRPET